MMPSSPVLPSGENEDGINEGVIPSEARDRAFSPEQHSPTRGMGSHDAPQGGIAPEPGSLPATGYGLQAPSIADRGLYHPSDAMRGMYDMGDAPSCHTCGAIMVRNGSCYRCMSCGSTSGCS